MGTAYSFLRADRGAASLLALGLAAGLLVPAPAAAWDDEAVECLSDPPPAQHLNSGSRVSRDLEYEQPRTYPGGGFFPTGCRKWHRYSFHATDADRVEVTFCRTRQPYGATYRESVAEMQVFGMPHGGGQFCPDHNTNRFTFLSDGDRTSADPYLMSAFVTHRSYHIAKYRYPMSYTIGVDITPNTRPTVQVLSAPAQVRPHDPIEVTVRANDADGRLRAVEMRRAGILLERRTVSGSQTTLTFTPTLDDSATLTFRVEDTFGATSSTNVAITLRQDDCGTGGDIDVLGRFFPFTCEANLGNNPGEPGDDERDSFVFSVPGGTDRVAVRYHLLAGPLTTGLALKDPSGATVASAVAEHLVADAVPGTWRLDATRVGGSGIYRVEVRAMGPPTPPAVSAAVSQTALHQGEVVTLDLSASDPNGQDLFYTVDWGDGSPAARVPAAGRVEDGHAAELTHRYRDAVTSPTIVVAAENEDGLTDSTAIDLTVRLHDDCGFGDPVYNAPASSADPTVRDLPSVCVGTLGYPVPDPPFQIDGRDVYRFEVDRPSWVTVRLETEPGLQAFVQFEYAGFGISSLGNTAQLILAWGTFYVRVGLQGGRGEYQLTATRDPWV